MNPIHINVTESQFIELTWVFSVISLVSSNIVYFAPYQQKKERIKTKWFDFLFYKFLFFSAHNTSSVFVDPLTWCQVEYLKKLSMGG